VPSESSDGSPPPASLSFHCSRAALSPPLNTSGTLFCRNGREMFSAFAKSESCTFHCIHCIVSEHRAFQSSRAPALQPRGGII
jgi:hypothetical protein